MYCYNCGKEIANSAVACVYCGRPVIKEKAEVEQIKKQSPIGWILGLVFAFVSPIIGVLIGLIGSFKYKEEYDKKRATSAMLISSAMLVSQAVVFAYGFAIAMQMAKPLIDAAIAAAGA